MLSEAALASFGATLFSMKPVGNLDVFAGLTAGRTDTETREIALSCSIIVVAKLPIVTWIGSSVLAFMGISVDSLRAAGALIVLLIGLHMLFNNDTHKHSKRESEDFAGRASVAVVPLAIPIVAGPGTMVAVLLAAHHGCTALGKFEISAVVICMLVLIGVVFSFAPTISRRIGVAGMGVVTRVMGMILVAIAIGMLSEALKALLPGFALGSHSNMAFAAA